MFGSFPNSNIDSCLGLLTILQNPNEIEILQGVRLTWWILLALFTIFVNLATPVYSCLVME
jgi:hypothetical protein